MDAPKALLLSTDSRCRYRFVKPDLDSISQANEETRMKLIKQLPASCLHQKTEKVLGNQSLTISRKPVGAWVMSQLLIHAGERSGLRTRIATTESVSLGAEMKS
jgi:hypothetical protein